MTPVRVVMDGGTFTLPLRMVSIGTGAETPIVLYVVGEGRYTTKEFTEVAINSQLLSWDFSTDESNYTDLRDYALRSNEGKSALPTFAQPNPFTTYSILDPNTGTSTTLLQTYVDQAAKNGEIPSSCGLPPPAYSGHVSNPCPPGEPWTSPACGTVPPGDIDARTLGCVGADDIAVAVTGMQLDTVFVTRLEMVLPKEALATDLNLEASMDQSQISNLLLAQIAVHPEDACASGLTPIVNPDQSKPKSPPYVPFIFGSLLSLAAALGLRRARVRRLARSKA